MARPGFVGKILGGPLAYHQRARYENYFRGQTLQVLHDSHICARLGLDYLMRCPSDHPSRHAESRISDCYTRWDSPPIDTFKSLSPFERSVLLWRFCYERHELDFMNN